MRLICSYPSANLFLDAYRGHLGEMAAFGFDTVLLCVPEHYVQYNLSAVRALIVATHAAGLACWADFWGGARTFDGEAPCNPTWEPEATIGWWTDAIAGGPPDARPDAVFWDNPFPANPVHIAAWVARASRLGIPSVVCLSWDRHRGDPAIWPLVAGLPGVVGISADPYDLGQPEARPIERWVGECAGLVGAAARGAKVESIIWTQGFGIPAGDEDLPVRAAQAAVEQGVDGVGFWAFRANCCWDARPERHEEVWSRFGEFLAVLRR